MASSPIHIQKLPGRIPRAGRLLRRIHRALPPLLCAVALAGCGSPGTQKIGMVAVAAAHPVYTIQLSRAVTTALPKEGSLTLPAASQWRRVGALPQGDVYRSLNGPFSINARSQAEVYLVASGGKLMGFYLPAENSYMALSRPVTLPVMMRQ